MPNLDDIKQPIATEWLDFEQTFDTAFCGNSVYENLVLSYIKQRKGKQLRPILTLLSAKICGEIGKKSHLAAAALEVLHTSSLLHDDVVDNATARHGQPSVNVQFDNRTAVLVGDLLLTKAMNFMTQTADCQMIDTLVRLGNEIAHGELLQLELAHKIPAESEYFDIIKAKTAILFASCMHLGAISANCTEKSRLAAEQFGMNLGICFQIKDDIFDYTPQANIGKNTLSDIREGKFSLPMIHAIENEPSAKNRIVEISKSAEKIEENSEFLFDFVARNGGLDYANQKMAEYRQKAIENLSIFPDSTEKKSLVRLLDFVLEREV